MNVFITEFKSLIKLMIIWSIGAAVLITMGMAESSGAQGMSSEELSSMINIIPDVVLALFGMSDVDLGSPLGYFSIISYYVAVISGLYGASLGGGAVYHDQMMKTGEFLYTKPYPKALILLYKLAARICIFVGYIVILDIVSVIALNSVPGGEEYALQTLQFNLTSLNTGIIMFCVSAFVSTLLRHGHELAGAVNYIVGIFFLTGFLFELTEIEFLRVLSPLKYVVFNDVMKGEIEYGLMFVTSLLSLIFIGLALLVFTKSEAK